MFVHNVYFWLKDEVTDEEEVAFRQGLESLKDIETVRALYVGRPVPSEREVVDHSYTFGLTAVFDDSDGHDAYQVHTLHKEFLDEFAHSWDRIVIYDME